MAKSHCAHFLLCGFALTPACGGQTVGYDGGSPTDSATTAAEGSEDGDSRGSNDEGAAPPNLPAADSSTCAHPQNCLLCDDHQFHCGDLVVPQCQLDAGPDTPCTLCVYCGDGGKGYRTACPGTSVVTLDCTL